MILKKLKEVNFLNETTNVYEFFYENNDFSNNFVGKDYWGYFNLNPLCRINELDKVRYPTPSFLTTDILQKIKYPTGGCAIFNYEANQYTFIGNTELTNFDENSQNYSFTNSSSLSLTDQLPEQSLPVSYIGNRKAKFYPSNMLQEDPNQNTLSYVLQKMGNSYWVELSFFNYKYKLLY